MVNFGPMLAWWLQRANRTTANRAAYFEELGPVFNLLFALLLDDLICDAFIHKSKLLVGVISGLVATLGCGHSATSREICGANAIILDRICSLLLVSVNTMSHLILVRYLCVFNLERSDLLDVTVSRHALLHLFLLILFLLQVLILFFFSACSGCLLLFRGRFHIGLRLTGLCIFTGDLIAFLCLWIKNRFDSCALLWSISGRSHQLQCLVSLSLACPSLDTQVK